VKGDGLQDSEGDYESDTQTNRKRISVSHGGKEEACNAEKQLRVERTEVSDQNFADDELEVDAESSKRSKKTRVCSTETLNDQVNSDAESA
jgi:phosphoribosylpyrophosphate synthetase